MKQNFLHFLSETPCILSINGENIGTIDNNSIFEIDVITKTDKIYLTYEPITSTNQTLPYTVLISTIDTPTTDNTNTRIIPFINNHYDIMLSPFHHYQIIDSKVLFNGTLGKYFVSIVADNMTKVIIYSGLSIVFNHNLPVLTNVKVDEIKDNIIIQGVISNDEYYLLVINTNNFEILFNDYVHSIELSQDIISIYQKTHSLCHHAMVCNINLTTKTSENFYVYDEDKKKNINTYLIPKALLECIKVCDDKSSKNLLSSQYQSTDITTLQNYFGDIKEIYLNRHEDNIHKINYTIKSDRWKNYNFFIENNLIYDIEEIF